MTWPDYKLPFIFEPEDIRSAMLEAIDMIASLPQGYRVRHIKLSEPNTRDAPVWVEAEPGNALNPQTTCLNYNLGKALQFIQSYTQARVGYNLRRGNDSIDWCVLQTRSCLQCQLDGALGQETVKEIIGDLPVVKWDKERDYEDLFADFLEILERQGRLEEYGYDKPQDMYYSWVASH